MTTAKDDKAPRGTTAPGDAPGDVQFESFVMGMATSALVHLGVAPHPETGEPARDIEVARQTIDLLAMLEDKTRGNLTERERQVLQATLYDLRMRYLDCCGD